MILRQTPFQGTEGIPLAFGNTILFKLLEMIFTNPHKEFVPPMTEIYHYPFLCVGWFGLFVTAMNLLPIGQLDGGHMIYAMFGNGHKKIARVFFVHNTRHRLARIASSCRGQSSI